MTAQETRTNARVIDLTSRRRPDYLHAAPFTPHEPAADLVCRWIEYLLNDRYWLLDIYIGSRQGAFGTEVLKAARVAALTDLEPPRLA